MKTIQVNRWTVGTNNETGEEITEDITKVLTVLINSTKPEKIPKGIDKFRLFNRIGKAFNKADKTSVLELEEGDYQFLKKIVEEEIIGIWGIREERSQAIEDFITAK
ncbi:MAG: hypothetical protein WC444_05505 [Candidatus Paceibacterota bacterium]